MGSDFVARTKLNLAAAGRSPPEVRGPTFERFEQVDFADGSQVRAAVESASESALINFAARTDVDPIERERPSIDRPPEGGSAWAVNALAPETIARAAKEGNKYFIQISTDFVFDGRSGPYGEDAQRSVFSPHLSWYGWTKSEAERRVLQESPAAAIVRIAYPYRAGTARKRDFAHNLMERYSKGTLPPLYDDQRITPTWIPDVSRTLDYLVTHRLSGVFHVASPQLTTPWEFATELVRSTTGQRVDLRRGSIVQTAVGLANAPRPVTGGLLSQKVMGLGITLTSWRDGIHELVREEHWE